MTVVVAPGGSLASLPNAGQAAPTQGSLTITSGQRSIDLVSRDGVEPAISLEMIYRTQPMVAALVNKLSRQISTLPLQVLGLNSQNEPTQVARDHGLPLLLRNPAPRKAAVDLKQWITRSLFINGNSLLAKYRGDGKNRPPTNLLPLRWPFVSAYAQLGGPVELWGTTQIGEWKWLPVDESLHFGWESDMGELGVSPLEQLGTVIKLDDASQRYQVASFVNGNRPSGAIVLPPDAKPTPKDEADMRAGLRQMHEGVDNSFRVALLKGGADWKPMSFSAVEAQLIEQRRLNLEDACMVYDVPAQLIAVLSRGTLSSVQEIHRMLYVTILRPWLSFIEERLTAQLVDVEPEWAADGLFLRFDTAEVLRGNSAEEITAAASGFQNGLLTLNEARRMLNLPKIDDPAADVPHIMANNQAPITGGTPLGGPAPLTPAALPERASPPAPES